jgi:hypothetical protein
MHRVVHGGGVDQLQACPLAEHITGIRAGEPGMVERATVERLVVGHHAAGQFQVDGPVRLAAASRTPSVGRSCR